MTDEQLLKWMTDYVGRNGYPPSVRECAQAIGKSVESAQRRIKRLEGRGLIERGPAGQSRSIRIVGKARTERM